MIPNLPSVDKLLRRSSCIRALFDGAPMNPSLQKLKSYKNIETASSGLEVENTIQTAETKDESDEGSCDGFHQQEKYRTTDIDSPGLKVENSRGIAETKDESVEGPCNGVRQQEKYRTTDKDSPGIQVENSRGIAVMKDKSFSEKKRWLHESFDKMKAASPKSYAVINVCAGSLLEDSVDTVLKLSPEELQAPWVFTSLGLPVDDNDRFEHEWFMLVLMELCEPNKGLWRNGCKQSDTMCLQIDHWSGKQKITNLANIRHCLQ